MTPFIREAARALVIIVAFVLFGVGAAWTLTPREACASRVCVASPCTSSASCVGGCGCVVPQGRALGYCADVR